MKFDNTFYRPLKNLHQDAEDSETSNNKSVQPSQYQETIDYVDDGAESETTTAKYTPPTRYRSSTSADNKAASPKYVILERNKSDRSGVATVTTSPAAEEELKLESPVTTQR